MGAGFAIAMRDLEIRGAGNILGTEQSGHIAVVGYELYCSLVGSGRPATQTGAAQGNRRGRCAICPAKPISPRLTCPICV